MGHWKIRVRIVYGVMVSVEKEASYMTDSHYGTPGK